MKGVFTLLFLFVSCALANGQELQKELDLLLNRIASLPASDTTAINLRNNYTKQALFANPADSTLTDFAQQTLVNAKKTTYPKGIMLAYERLALISQYAFSNPYKALDYYHKALSVAEHNPSLSYLKWGILGGIATIHYEQEEYEKALHGFKEILQNNKALELTATANIANVYGALRKTDSAIFYYKKALTLKQLETNPTYKANLYSNLSLMYENAGNAEEAVISVEKSLGLIDAYGIEFVRPTAYANASMAYLKTGNLEKSEYFAKESLKLSETQENLFMQKSAWGTLADVFTAKGEYKKALEAHIKFSSLKDSLNNQNRRVEIARKQMAFDFENEHILIEAEIKRQATIKRAFVLGGIGLLLMSILGFILYKRKRDTLAQKQEAEFKALVSDTELKALRAQMNPHFIFNSLNSIGDYILKNDTTFAQDYLTRFAKLMRMSLENSEFKEIPLSEDLKFIELYLQVESKRLPDRFSYTVKIANDIDAENTLVPPLILQPFIENSIWHGFKSKDSNGHILVEIKKVDGILVCSVDDNGSGRNQTGTESHNKKSMGITITENRIKILNKQKNANGKLQIIDKPNDSGTRIEISLPLQTAF
ncbi:hypothetical protein APS56_15930 [Pseudalgibacter alginicilyticus]|uniref:Signal transduction histidine kinase internal region domain-containing protein n=1 Tax=Pseudalgibacter alginicilyticus TaxID=1736674 RepID=A0A0P0DEP8_9FLAO|nr:histidine kinase [Pseudalgibacter alginicilyticus]ALJ06531.1 hypothetical protein APS56_15930 [Pseudalgibacter alginicilyticus]